MEFVLEELITANGLLDLIWETSSEGMVITNSSGIILKTNSAFCNMYCISHDNIIGNNISVIYPENIREEAQKQHNLLFNASKIPEIFKNQITFADGTEKYLETKICFLEKDGKRLAMLSVIKDISELEQLKNEYHHVIEKAEESDRLKTAFLANLSHEIRTPMNGIIGFAGMLIDPDLPLDKRNQFIEIIISSSNQLLSLIDDIIDLSKIEAGQIEINNKEFNINILMNDLLKFYLPTAKSKGLKLLLKENFLSIDTKIITDEIKVKQILNNLLSNALKFTHEGFVEFGYTVKDRYMEFFVKDSGIGVDKKLHKVIFERFRQVDSANTRKYGGTGLGLPISKSYVELLGGRIWLESKENNGSEFYFTIPYHPVLPEKSKEFEVISNEMPDWSSKTLIIAEDEEINFFYIFEVFSGTGINILRAKTGNEAIEIVQNNPNIDLILMDIKMPELNGYEATKIIKQINPNIPIIAQTAYAMAGDKEIALSAGCDDYISKPVKRDKLISIVSNFLNS